tara:strand:+ start:508 stop:1356 length:849 start_codon:yes stop_codon:yes gene_type:complete
MQVLYFENKRGVKYPKLTWTRLSNLEVIEGSRAPNREEDKSHTATMEDAILDNGFMDVYKVFPKNPKTNKYKIAEASHRYRGNSNIMGAEDPMVPIAILHWLNGDDEEEVVDTVSDFNTTGKTWQLWDFVKVRASVSYYSSRVKKSFKHLYESMKRFKPTITNSVVAQIFTAEPRVHNVIRDKELAKQFDITDRKYYIDLMLNRLNNLVINHGKTLITNGFLRRYVNGLNKKIDQFKDEDKWNEFFNTSLTEVNILVKQVKGGNAKSLPNDDVAFKAWFDAI